jgi:hypothetical protein
LGFLKNREFMKSNLKCGRELDKLIAESVMDLETGSIGDRLIVMTVGGCGTHACQKLHPKTMPEYSTDIAAAWEVVEKLRLSGLTVDINAYPENREWLEPPYEGAKAQEWKLTKSATYYMCRISKYNEDFAAWVCYTEDEGDSPAHAICLAALKTIK